MLKHQVILPHETSFHWCHGTFILADLLIVQAVANTALRHLIGHCSTVEVATIVSQVGLKIFHLQILSVWNPSQQVKAVVTKTIGQLRLLVFCVYCCR